MEHKSALWDTSTNQCVIAHLEIAHTAWTRFRGLMLRRRVPQSYGMLIYSCKSIHTMWMRMKIDVYFLDEDQSVLGMRLNVRPWRVVIASRGTTSVLETPPGQNQFQVGTRLRVRVGDKR